MDTHVSPPVPASAPAPAAQEPQDPTWWRLGSIPFIVLILAAVGLDLACPGESFQIGIGAGIGCACWCLAILLLRRDLSRPETLFLAALGLINLLALVQSGNAYNWALSFAVPLVMLMMPRRQSPAVGRFRNWWSYWFALRKSAGTGRWSWLRQILPAFITVAVGAALFIVFLIIFASGNPVVQLVWETLRGWWNALVEWLELDWDFAEHVFHWVLAFLLFGFYAFERPSEAGPAQAAPVAQEQKPQGRTLLPHLPLASLIGVNLAFLVTTSTDVAYLWFGRVPEGVTQTAYLHEGAASVAWAAALAALLLVFLFRRKGSARQGRATRVAGYVLAFQTFLLAVSVYVRLFHQIGDYGFTPRRVQAAEALLLGLDGLVILVCYIACSGSFWKYTRMCLGSMLLMAIAFGICPPAQLAGNLNLRYAPTHPHWKFSENDFKPNCFHVSDNLAFALYVQEQGGISPEERDSFALRLYSAARTVQKCKENARESLLLWNFSLDRDAYAAAKILAQDPTPGEVERLAPLSEAR